MSRIMEAWEDVLKTATSSNFDDQQFALFQIGLVLERHHNPNPYYPVDIYTANLPHDLVRLKLNDAKQREAILYLAALLKSDSKRADIILFAISKGQPTFIAEIMPSAILELAGHWDEPARFEAVNVLEICFKSGTSAYPQLKLLMPLLEQWATADEPELANKADRLLAKLEKLN